MSEPLAERLRRQLAEQKQEHEADVDLQAYQARVDSYISDHAKEEYDRLLQHLQDSINQVNPAIGDLPPFRFIGGMFTVQQDNCVASLYFDKPVVNGPQNRLLVAFGPHPNNIYFDGPPASLRYMLQASATDALDGIVWTGDLGEMTTPQLSDFILENLTTYYLEHKPGS